jgi:hypothetical protein
MFRAGYFQFVRLVRLVRLVSLASLALVALTAIFLTTTSAAELDRPAGASVQGFKAVELSRPAVPCTNGADEREKCCSLLHCQVGIVIHLPHLPNTPMTSRSDFTTADFAPYVAHNRLERPPKS